MINDFLKHVIEWEVKYIFSLQLYRFNLMREDTKIIQRKYKYINYLLFNERHDLFKTIYFDDSFDNFVETYDNEKYVDLQFYYIFQYKVMHDMFLNFLSYRSKIMKKFERERIILKRKAIRDLLCSVVCFDISTLITEFIL